MVFVNDVSLTIEFPHQIDKFDDEGKLGNHKIFFTNKDESINKNTITELVFIPIIA